MLFLSFSEKLKRDSKKSTKKESCPFCQEQKKRPLIAYMRKMALEKQKSQISEEDENEEEHCHNYDGKEMAKKWILLMPTINLLMLTCELDVDNVINITIRMNNLNILVSFVGFHSIVPARAYVPTTFKNFIRILDQIFVLLPLGVSIIEVRCIRSCQINTSVYCWMETHVLKKIRRKYMYSCTLKTMKKM